MRSLTAILTLIVLGACYREQRLVNYRPPFTGIEGAVFQTEPTRTADELPAQADPTTLFIEHDDGSRTLVISTGRHLMVHIRRCLAEDQVEEFTEQVLSEVTRDEYLVRGLDPEEAFHTLKERERDVALLFSRMPMGEHSPTVLMQKIAHRTYRIKVTGHAAKGLTWTMMDMRFEDGHWRLRWFG
jgi:hypothetical protein